MIIHVIDSGVVVNSIDVPDGVDPATYGGAAADDLPAGVGIGWTYDGAAWTAPADPEPSPPSLSELFEQARKLVENHTNEMARTRRYTDAVSCASYVASTNATWSAEARAFVGWRDTVWAQVYALEDRALAGEIGTLPTADELIAGLPVMAWPD